MAPNHTNSKNNQNIYKNFRYLVIGSLFHLLHDSHKKLLYHTNDPVIIFHK